MTTLIPKYDLMNGGLTPAGAVNRPINLKLQESVSIKDFGAVGDGTTDDTAAIQAAINAVATATGAYQLFIPEGTYRCTAPLTIYSEMSILGVGASPYEGAVGTMGDGSWFYFDHTGYGIHIFAPLGTVLSGLELRNFGTYRNQPTPAASWAPAANDFDIFITGSDVLIEDLMLLNPTRGISLTSAGYGRLQINRVRGCAFDNLIYISESFDTTHIDNIHQWPFWSQSQYIFDYQLANLDVIWSNRNDNCILSNFFAIFASSNLRISNSASGTSYQFQGINLGFDRCRYGIWVEVGADAFSGRFSNLYHQGETTSATDSMAIFVQANNSNIQIENFQCSAANWNAMRIQGTGNNLHLGANINCFGYDANLAGYPAIEVASGSAVYSNGIPYVNPVAGSSAVKYGGAGDIYTNEWLPYTPIVRSITGTITSYTATGWYKKYGNTVEYLINVSITDNGTGSGQLGATLPVSLISTSPQCVGYGVNQSAETINGRCGPGISNELVIVKYNGTYPVTTGGSISISGGLKL